jgi:hypothetical protein
MVSYAKRGEILEELRGRSNKTWIVLWGPVRCGHVERVTGNGLYLGILVGPAGSILAMSLRQSILEHLLLKLKECYESVTGSDY